MSLPAISILVPIYNAEKTIQQALWSIINQSFTDFEIVIYLDGSTDKSTEIVKQFEDERIILFQENENKGIVFARNFLVNKAKGKYLAWLDADDYMLPNRLALQFNYLENNPEIFMVASAVEVRNDHRVKKVLWPSKPSYLKAWMFFRNPLVQSSLMLRNHREMIQFHSDFEYLEDYHFYSRIYLNHQIGYLPVYLSSYYQESQTALISKYRKYNFVDKLENIMQNNFSILNLNSGKNELALIREFLRTKHKIKKTDADAIYAFLDAALANNEKLQVFEKQSFKSIVYFQYFRLFKYSKTFSIPLFLKLLFHPITCLSAIKARPRYQ